VFDYLMNMVDRKGNCFVLAKSSSSTGAAQAAATTPGGGGLVLLDNDSGSFDPARQYPAGTGMAYPSLKRVRLRDVIEDSLGIPPQKSLLNNGTRYLLLRGQIRKQNESFLQIHCVFRRRTINRLEDLRTNPGVSVALRAMIASDSVLRDVADTLLDAHGLAELDRRVERLLLYVDKCVDRWGSQHVLR